MKYPHETFLIITKQESIELYNSLFQAYRDIFTLGYLGLDYFVSVGGSEEANLKCWVGAQIVDEKKALNS